MKTQLSKPARSKARYTEEYKQEALELWRNSGRSAAKVAAELGIRAPLLYRWARPKRQEATAENRSRYDWVDRVFFLIRAGHRSSISANRLCTGPTL